jgi:hypothetical protein
MSNQTQLKAQLDLRKRLQANKGNTFILKPGDMVLTRQEKDEIIKAFKEVFITTE